MAKTADIKISSVNIASRKDLDMRTGDSVRVWIKVEEKGKTRLQAFEGTVLARKGGTEPGATFTVRRVSGGYGVEKIFPIYSPLVDKIEVLRRVKTRRSKLYHIRDKAAREIRRQMRKMHTVNYTTDVPIEEMMPEVVAEPSSAEASEGKPKEIATESQPTEVQTDVSSEVSTKEEGTKEETIA